VKVGDLVRLSEYFSNPATIQDMGFGLVEKVYTEYFTAEVVWPQKSRTSNKIPWSHLEVVSANRQPG
tara:strand:- start:3011 stop:3211 length:201 start_codon:yes stop_codon:yes gene_type:complete